MMNSINAEFDHESQSLSREYWAFISYKHTDNRDEGRQWATWLHQQLENYVVPEDLVGKVNEVGATIPERIFPVFRDEEELSAGNDLTNRIYSALDRSRVLIVLCSPWAVESAYVFEEIRYFKMSGKSANIFSAIIHGEPSAQTVESGKCFPDSLVYEFTRDGKILLNHRTEPLAADFRAKDGSQGWTSPAAYRQYLESHGLGTKYIGQLVEEYEKRLEHSVLSLISGILSVPFGTLQERDKAYQLEKAQREAKVVRRWLACVGGLTLLALIAAIIALNQRNQAQENFIAAKSAADGLVSDIARDLRDVKGMPAKSVQKILKTAEATFEKLLRTAPDNPELLRSQIRMHNEFVNTYIDVGDTKSAERSADISITVSEKLFEKNSEDTDLAVELAMSYLKQGDAFIEVGKMHQAEESYSQSLALRRKLLVRYPNNNTHKYNVSVALLRLAEIGEMREDVEFMFPLVKESVSLRRDLTKGDKTKTGPLLVGLIWYADVAILKNDTQLAQELFLEAELIGMQLVEEDEISERYARYLAIVFQRIGNLAMLEKKFEEAERYYKKSYAGFLRLSAMDPSNLQFKSDLAIGKLKVATALEGQESLDKASSEYKEALDLFEQLINNEEQVANWRTDLAEVYFKLGKLEQDTLLKSKYFTKARAILNDLRDQGAIGEKHEGWLKQVEMQQID